MFQKAIPVAILALTTLFSSPSTASLEQQFAAPPEEARPWVYWFWLNGNITREGITADLEAMKEVGIAGVLIMEVDQGAPVGPVDFMSTAWRDLFQHVHAEAQRLGLQVNMNNDAGWNGSGGPWITPAESMQEIVWTETPVTGPGVCREALPTPPKTAGYYDDIVVLAVPATGDYRIPGFQGKAAFQRRDQPIPPTAEFTTAIDPPAVLDISSHMDAQGKLTWNIPAGEWTILRIGHTSTGVVNQPAPASGRGLECDKLSPRGIEANFSGMMAALAADNGLPVGQTHTGLVATHIDSWENGTQNWTDSLPREFSTRRGYDPAPYLPVLTGRVVTSIDVSERFLRDWRRTISELVIEQYAGRMRELAHEHGMRFTVEAYGSPCDYIPYAGQSDEPMGEFWTPGGGAMETCRGMASAGHIYGKKIIGAEAFTSADQERWQEHPASLKALGDRAFCEGINRFVFHRYAMQPWLDYQPGMTMGPWGQHYERTQTWWNWTTPWHEYLARCQFMLRQGLVVADICYLLDENSPQGFGNHPRNGYHWDECTDHAVLTRMSARKGRIILPDGMQYRLLVLPDARSMTPELLRKIKQLVQDGATILGPPPTHSPSLANYPACDQEVQALSRELWGDCNGTTIKQHPFGAGSVLWGYTPEQALQALHTPPDFTSNHPLNFIHRKDGDCDLYFVANPKPFAIAATCTFRTTHQVPEIWDPETGSTRDAALFESADGVTRVHLSLPPAGSRFVVFRRPSTEADPILTVRRDGEQILSAQQPPASPITVVEARYGVLDNPELTRDVTAKVQAKLDRGESSFLVRTLSDGDDPALNKVKTVTVTCTVDGKSFTVRGQDPQTILINPEVEGIVIESARYGVLDDPARTRDVKDRVQKLANAGELEFTVARMAEGDDPAFLVVKTLEIHFTRNGEKLFVSGKDPEPISLAPTIVPDIPIAAVQIGADREYYLETSRPGIYDLTRASGKVHRVSLPEAPEPQNITGPWSVHFPVKGDSPRELVLPELQSWSLNPDPVVRFFSGTATYAHTLQLDPTLSGPDLRIFLDLGEVCEFASVKLNGHDLGILWKAPFITDITDQVQPGANTLEIKVVNLWVNRMIGDEFLPEDSERNPNGTLKSWPDWVNAGTPSPTGRTTFTSWRLWRKDDPLRPSGILGPVTIRAVRTVKLAS